MKIIKCKSGNILGVLKEVENVDDKVIRANSVDASSEKHVPNFEITGDKVRVYVSHVMEEDHYIEWILVDYGKKQIIEHFMPGDTPSIIVPYSDRMRAYSYCNKHSLWMNELKKGGSRMLLVSTENVFGKEISESLGIVKGEIVQSKNFGRDFMAGMKTLVGGEIKGYTEMIKEAREIATKRMIEDAEKLGADAVVGVRYGSSAVMQGAAEMIVYGTAVKLK
ncbi:MAG: heavy metal-binding domain-containing protein [Bacilli bacterium]|nr:heavy metal-binding domain-containing protein [Bacilli bacterium]